MDVRILVSKIKKQDVVLKYFYIVCRAPDFSNWLTRKEMVPWSCCTAIHGFQCSGSATNSGMYKSGCLQPLYYELITENIWMFIAVMSVCLLIQV